MTATKLEAFVIHLERAHQRRPQVERIVAACPVPVHVLDAVDGPAMTENERAGVCVTGLYKPRYPFQIGHGEIGCFLSHRKAWQAIVDRGLTAGLVIEDDVEIETEVFGKALALAAEHVGRHGIVQFQVRDIARPGAVVARNEDAVLTQPRIVPLRLSCTLYSAEAARRLLELTERFDRPVDGIMQLTWVTGLFPVIVIPSGVTELSGAIGGTTAQRTDVPLLTIVRREVLRPLYRLAIARRSAGVGRPR